VVGQGQWLLDIEHCLRFFIFVVSAYSRTSLFNALNTAVYYYLCLHFALEMIKIVVNSTCASRHSLIEH